MKSRTLFSDRQRRLSQRTSLAPTWIVILFCSTFAVQPYSQASSAAETASEINEEPITDFDRDHWSFRPLARPSLPGLAAGDDLAASWPRTEIDRFILVGLQASKLTPLPEADRATLIRRVYFDLLGLPPTPAQVFEFTTDPATDAYERLVDRLLASHHYGERWAQHWLDLARFAETDGFEHDKTRKDAWRYRDWVIDALNDDLPYDQFVHRQLAGDQLAPQTQSARIATTFCLAGPDMPDINSQVERKHHLLNEITSTVGAALMGLQVGCAQCHDHKYDPISQADFYRLRAVFEPAVVVKKNESVSVLHQQDRKVRSHLMIRGDWQRAGPEIDPGVPRIANPAGALSPLTPSSGSPRIALARWLTQADHPLTSRVIVNRLWQHHFGNGLSRTPSDFGLVGEAPSHPELLDWLATELMRHDWQLKHLHRSVLVSATYRQASRPWQQGWSSEQQAAAAASWERSRSLDEPNYWLARFPRRRLTGEEVRDAMLVSSDSMDWRRGGPGVRPPLPDELVKTLLKNQWKVSPDRADHFRRSIYIFARRNLRFPIFEAFDRPDGNASCARRGRSTTAPQSLLLLNSHASLDASKRLAGVVLAASAELDTRLTTAVLRVLGRQPGQEERAALAEFLEGQRLTLESERRAASELALPVPVPPDVDSYEAAAWTDLCLALYNLSEFLYID